ncbi:MAG: patatin-like phospholipase family protein [Bacteroidales bacterium]|nr:patatin-like phospholipase family protein [Bacteroidales bacterium]
MRKNGLYIGKIFLMIAVLAMCSGTALGESAQKVGGKRPKVALVLCGGGAKGAAHIGALKVLEEVGMPVDMVVGTSIGGLVGGMYAMGYNAAELDSIVAGCDWKYLLSDNTYSRRDESFSGKMLDARYLLKIPFYSMNPDIKDSPVSRLPAGLISGQNVLNFLNGVSLGYQERMDFSNLPVPFACVAADLSTGEQIVLDKGELPLCMRATMAIPGVFAPVEMDGKVLVDGGIINNFPVDVAKKMGADIIIGVDIKNDYPGAENLKSIPQVLAQMIALMGNETYQKNLKEVDILIKPDVSDYGTYSFNKPAIEQLVINGYVAAQEKYQELEALARRLNTLDVGSRPGMVHKATDVVRDTFCFKSVEIVGVPKKNEHWLRRMSGLKPDILLTGKDINRGISILMGTRAFSSVTYTVMGKGTADERLVVNIVEGPTNVLALGARYDSEEAAGILVHVGVNEYGLLGSKLGFTGRLGYNPYGQLEYSYNSKDFPKIEFNYKVGGMDMNIYKSTENQNNLSFLYHRGEINLSNIYLRNFNFKLGARYEHFDFSRYLKQNTPDGYQEYVVKDSGYESYYFKGEVDTRDDSYFATEGVDFDVEGTIWQTNFEKGFHSFGAVKVMLEGAVGIGKSFALLPHFYGRVIIGDCTEIPFINYVGGSEPGRYFSQQLPFIGINYANPVENTVMIGRIDLRQKIASNHYIYGIANYMRSAHSLDDIFSDNGEGTWGVGFKYSYNSPIGPLSFNIHWSDYEHRAGAYVSLGHYF